MTAAETLAQRGWTRVRAEGNECGEALTNSGRRLNGLACEKGAVWAKDGEPTRCAQHALLVP